MSSQVYLSLNFSIKLVLNVSNIALNEVWLTKAVLSVISNYLVVSAAAEQVAVKAVLKASPSLINSFLTSSFLDSSALA